MTNRSIGLVLVSALCLPALVAGSAAGEPPRPGGSAAATFRPDQLITLCGLSTGCTINPPPHPWRGNDVYNSTGRRQRVAVRMQDGEGVRFWLRFETDGSEPDTIRVDGCRGTRRFEINAVLVGKHKRPNWRARNITRAFRKGTATFRLPGRSARRFLTLNIVAPTPAEGVTWRCPVTISSKGDPSMTDTVVAIITTY
jgi:hypothetical protein